MKVYFEIKFIKLLSCGFRCIILANTHTHTQPSRECTHIQTHISDLHTPFIYIGPPFFYNSMRSYTYETSTYIECISGVFRAYMEDITKWIKLNVVANVRVTFTRTSLSAERRDFAQNISIMIMHAWLCDISKACVSLLSAQHTRTVMYIISLLTPFVMAAHFWDT